MSKWRWLTMSLWAVLDQGLFAGANFVLNLVLARWLGSAEYGVFSVTYSIFLLGSLLVTNLLLDPMLQFGAKRWRSSLRPYMRVSLWLLALLVVGIAIAIALAGVLAERFMPDGSQLARALVMIAAVAPGILLMWTLRRALYVISKPHIAAVGGTIYMVALGAALAISWVHLNVDAASAVLLMAPASLLASAYMLWQLHLLLNATGDDVEDPPETAVVLREHWNYGRWLLAGAALSWVAGQHIVGLYLTTWHGFEVAGYMKALLNLLMPISHTLVALVAVSLPRLVRTLASEKRRRGVTAWLIGVNAMGAAYSVFLFLFGDEFMVIVYGQGYQGLVPVVRVFAVLPLLSSAQHSLGALLRALARTRAMFFASGAAAAIMLTGGLVLTHRYSLMGAAMALILSNVASLLVLGWRLREELRSGAPVDQSSLTAPLTLGGS